MIVSEGAAALRRWRDEDLPRLTAHRALAAAEEHYGSDHIAFHYLHGGVRLTLSELERQGRRWAAALIAAGVGKGDRVSVCLPGHPAWPPIQIGCSMAGAVVVGINTRYRVHEMREVLRRARPKAVITMEDWRSIEFAKILSAVLDELGEDNDWVKTVARVTLGPEESFGFTPAERWLERGEEAAGAVATRAASVSPDDLALIQFTSGSTAAPKGVMIRHDTLCRTAFHVMSTAAYDPTDVIYSALPFYHVGGSICTGIGPLVCGARMVVPATFEAEASVHDAIEHGCTGHQGHSAMFMMQIDAARRLGLIDQLHLRKGWVAAPPSTLRSINDELNAPGIVSVYGMSEYGIVSSCVADDPLEKRVGTVGMPTPGTEVRIAGGEEGEIEVRGSQLMAGYFEDEEATRAAMTPDGWFKTGDRARFDEDGFLVFSGREKDMIKPGGENVSAAEVEEFLIRHPGVAAVAVVGVPDERLGQVPGAVIEPRPGAVIDLAEIQRFCAGRIAKFKTPKAVFCVDEIPLLANGKIDKQTLRARYGGAAKEDDGDAY